jgi:hypothetical protein
MCLLSPVDTAQCPHTFLSLPTYCQAPYPPPPPVCYQSVYNSVNATYCQAPYPPPSPVCYPSVYNSVNATYCQAPYPPPSTVCYQSVYNSVNATYCQAPYPPPPPVCYPSVYNSVNATYCQAPYPPPSTVCYQSVSSCVTAHLIMAIPTSPSTDLSMDSLQQVDWHTYTFLPFSLTWHSAWNPQPLKMKPRNINPVTLHYIPEDLNPWPLVSKAHLPPCHKNLKISLCPQKHHVNDMKKENWADPIIHNTAFPRDLAVWHETQCMICELAWLNQSHTEKWWYEQLAGGNKVVLR